MDISKAILAKSDQLNAVDIIGEVAVTITAVHPGPDDAEVRISTDVFGTKRPYIPPKTVLREIGKVWGRDTQAWIGRRMVVYNLPSVRYGGEEVGGVRIRALSDIDKPITYLPPQADGLGKGAKVTIRPLTADTTTDPVPRDESGRDWLAELKLAGDNLDAITTLGAAARTANAGDNIIKAILAEHGRVKTAGQVEA